MSKLFRATRYFFSIAARVTGLGSGSRGESGVHVHWDRISRQWVRRDLD